ncbi:Permease of the drug/metabolite transporter (DMT) superfamily [Cupriavidus sp. U2]|uniref:DMT family transporter n=1 Tax=Cupriavidus sp. U2 TaxID=2920269 RepID=UPI00129D55C0|nr:DMT family transporter [Cupriavidus sp. U2]KAI3593014.1 Permease of the drug/metabolite transporter (DMT) superfamily [Cupriavidus sp. U2]
MSAIAPAGSARSAAFKSFLPLIGAVIIWGGNWPVMKFGLSHVSPLWFAALRFGSAALISFVVLGALKRLRLPSRQEWPLVFSVGLLQMAAFTALALWALQYVAPGRASVVAYATAIWVIPLSSLVLGERPSRWQWLATGFSYAGIAVIVAPALGGWELHTVMGLTMLLGASLAWSVSIIHLRAHRHVRLGAEMIPWECAVATVPLVLLAVLRDGAPDLAAMGEIWPAVLYTGPLATALTFIVVLNVTQSLPPAATSIAMLGVPLLGLVLSAVAWHERISADLSIGLGLIALGVVTTALAPRLGRLASRGSL